MPANLTAEFQKKYMEYLKVKNIDERIRLLKELIALAPKHKGTEKLLARLKRTLAKLQDQKEAEKRMRRARASRGIRKVAPMIVIVGPPNSGKTTLFKMLTGKGDPKPWPYSTQQADTAVIKYLGAKLQFVDPPSFDQSIANNADLVLFVKEDPELERYKRKKYIVYQGESKEELLAKIWESLDLIRVFTEDSNEAMLLKKGSTVKDAAEKINKKFVEYFEYAKVLRNGKPVRVGLDFQLEDGDRIWIKTRA